MLLRIAISSTSIYFPIYPCSLVLMFYVFFKFIKFPSLWPIRGLLCLVVLYPSCLIYIKCVFDFFACIHNHYNNGKKKRKRKI